MPTGIAALQMTAQSGRPTLCDVFQHSVLDCRRWVSAAVLIAVGTHHVGDLEARSAFGGHFDRPGSAEFDGGRSTEKIEWTLHPTEVCQADVGIDLGGAQ